MIFFSQSTRVSMEVSNELVQVGLQPVSGTYNLLTLGFV